MDAGMGAEHFPQPAVPAFTKEVQVQFTDGRPGSVRVVEAVGELPSVSPVGRFQLVTTDPILNSPS